MAQLEDLIKINTADFLKALGLNERQNGRHLLAWLCRYPARRFAQQVVAYDQRVGAAGLQAGGQWVIDTFRNRLLVTGAENVPRAGPVFFLANHPGLTDTMALFAAIPRPDLRVLAAQRPFLCVLPHTSRHLIYLDETATHNLAAVRTGVNHLRTGGALLTFPAGKIEPDPALQTGALESLAAWNESIALFAKRVPEAIFVPTLVSGVLHPGAQHSPLRLLRRSRKDQEWLASTLQIIIPAWQAVTVRVQFGAPLLPAAFAGKAGGLMAAVRAGMQGLMEVKPM